MIRAGLALEVSSVIEVNVSQAPSLRFAFRHAGPIHHLSRSSLCFLLERNHVLAVIYFTLHDVNFQNFQNVSIIH